MPRAVQWKRRRRRVRFYANIGVSSLLLSDTFADTNGTALGSHTMDVGGGWSVILGVGDIQSNRARHVSGAILLARADAQQSNVTAQAVISTVSGGVAVRVADSSNFFFGYLSVLNEVAIWERSAGTFTKRASTAHTVAANETLVVTASGTTISATVGAHNANYGSASAGQTETRHGLYSDGAGVTFDNFQVVA